MSRTGASVGLLPSRLLGLPAKASIIFQSSGVAMTRAGEFLQNAALADPGIKARLGREQRPG
jgi:hypothetical protein